MCCVLLFLAQIACCISNKQNIQTNFSNKLLEIHIFIIMENIVNISLFLWQLKMYKEYDVIVYM